MWEVELRCRQLWKILSGNARGRISRVYVSMVHVDT